MLLHLFVNSRTLRSSSSGIVSGRKQICLRRKDAVDKDRGTTGMDPMVCPEQENRL